MTKYGPESKDLWIQSRVDELVDDDEWLLKAKEKWFYCEDDVNYSMIKSEALEQAQREHADIMADLEEVIIDSMEWK